jgi:imidazolonepropionase-like amidohydrolase
MAATAIVGGRLIDGAGSPAIADCLVLIEDGRIVHTGPRGSARIPDGAAIIDAAGGTVLPGLMDVHVHISMSSPTDWRLDHYRRSPGRIAFETAANLRMTLDAGVTTIRTVSDVAHLDIAARDAVRDGLFVGPRVVPCGKGLTSTGGHGQKLPCWICQSHGEVVEIVDGVDAITGAVRRQARAGAEWIKVFQTGGVVDKHGRIDAEEFLPEEFEAAIATAKLLGMPVAVHAHNRPAILRSIRAGCRSVEHGMDFDEECARAAVEHGAFLVPTLTVMDRIVRYGKDAGVAAYVIDNVRRRTEQHVKYVRFAHEIGVDIAAGTDAGSILTPHGSAGREVANLGRIGIPALAAIRSATETAARLLRIDDRVGTLAPGKLADVIVVNGNVESDLSLLEGSDNIRIVMLSGRIAVDRRGSHGKG